MRDREEGKALLVGRKGGHVAPLGGQGLELLKPVKRSLKMGGGRRAEVRVPGPLETPHQMHGHVVLVGYGADLAGDGEKLLIGLEDGALNLLDAEGVVVIQKGQDLTLVLVGRIVRERQFALVEGDRKGERVVEVHQCVGEGMKFLFEARVLGDQVGVEHHAQVREGGGEGPARLEIPEAVHGVGVQIEAVARPAAVAQEVRQPEGDQEVRGLAARLPVARARPVEGKGRGADDDKALLLLVASAAPVDGAEVGQEARERLCKIEELAVAGAIVGRPDVPGRVVGGDVIEAVEGGAGLAVLARLVCEFRADAATDPSVHWELAHAAEPDIEELGDEFFRFGETLFVLRRDAPESAGGAEPGRVGQGDRRRLEGRGQTRRHRGVGRRGVIGAEEEVRARRSQTGGVQLAEAVGVAGDHLAADGAFLHGADPVVAVIVVHKGGGAVVQLLAAAAGPEPGGHAASVGGQFLGELPRKILHGDGDAGGAVGGLAPARGDLALLIAGGEVRAPLRKVRVVVLEYPRLVLLAADVRRDLRGVLDAEPRAGGIAAPPREPHGHLLEPELVGVLGEDKSVVHGEEGAAGVQVVAHDGARQSLAIGRCVPALDAHDRSHRASRFDLPRQFRACAAEHAPTPAIVHDVDALPVALNDAGFPDEDLRRRREVLVPHHGHGAGVGGHDRVVLRDRDGREGRCVAFAFCFQVERISVARVSLEVQPEPLHTPVAPLGLFRDLQGENALPLALETDVGCRLQHALRHGHTRAEGPCAVAVKGAGIHRDPDGAGGNGRFLGRGMAGRRAGGQGNQGGQKNAERVSHACTSHWAGSAPGIASARRQDAPSPCEKAGPALTARRVFRGTA